MFQTTQNLLSSQISRVRKRVKHLPVICALALASPLAFPQDVLTQHYDNARTGQNLSEYSLTPSNVNSNSFGKLFSVSVDGYIYAQPLYLSNLAIPGKGTHNVVFVATEHDSVYAFDADTNSGGALWKASLLDGAHGAASGARTVQSSEVGTSDISPEIGITGTPVINKGSGTLYVVSKSVENGAFVQRLHALDVGTGQEKLGGPVTLQASIPGTGNGSSGGFLRFDPKWSHNRPGLLLLNGIIYIGFGSHGDNGPWHGWILAYNAGNLSQTAAFCPTPNGIGSAFWMSGAGLSADVTDPSGHPYGRMFAPTANGTFDASRPYGSNMDFGDDELRLDLSGGVPTVVDAFTPTNQLSLDESDSDFGSGGSLLLPDQPGSHPHLLVQAGKEGTIYLIDRDNLGGYNSTDNVVQELHGQTYGLWSSAAYWNDRVYLWGTDEPLKAFSLSNGQLSSSPVSTSSETYGFPGATPVISANGASNGIVWSLQTDAYGSNGPAVLHAHDAVNLGRTLYSSNQNASRDNPGGAVKFTVPTVANGKVYVPTQGQLSVYGLFGGTQQTSVPSFSPGSETFTGTISVSLSDDTSGAEIFYTTDGSTPSQSSASYSGPITVTSTTTIKALAVASGYLQSPVVSATYNLQNQTATPAFSPAGGAYTSAQSVTISDSTPNAVIHYTLDGSTPTASSAQYSSPIRVASSLTIKAIAVTSGQQSSATATAAYSIQTSGNGINLGSGFSTAPSVMTFNGSTRLDDTRLQLTNGGVGEAGSAFYNTAFNITSFTNDFTLQLSAALADGITFTIQRDGPTALGPGGGGLGYGPDVPGGTGGIPNSVAIKFDIFNNDGEGTDSTGLYKNGESPSVPANDMTSSGIRLASGNSMAVHMTYDGSTLAMSITDNVTGARYSTNWTVDIPSTIGGTTAYLGFTGGTGGLSASQKVLTWTFTTGSSTKTAAAPQFSPAGGTYSSAQTVTLSDSTPGASIRYTLNGSTPTSSSAGYSGPITVSSSTTIKALAMASGYAASPVATASYVIQSAPSAGGIAFGSGFSAATSTMTFNGNAQLDTSRLQLTDGGEGEASSAFFNTALDIQGFTTDFTFQALNAAADGFTFAIQGNDPTAIGPLGGGLGYGPQSPGGTGGIPNSVAVKFDFFNNLGEGTDSTGLYLSGASPTTPAIDLSNTGINLANGNVMAVHLTYDGTTLTMKITDTVTRATFSNSWNVNIPAAVGGNSAYIGFTAGDGGLTANQEILTWTFSSTP